MQKAEEVDALTTYGFLQRLAKTEIGQAIIERVGPTRERAQDDDAKLSAQRPTAPAANLTQEDHNAQRALLQDLARTYERYTAAANEAYRKRGRTVAMIYALAIALVFNISAWQLFSHLMDSPEAREDLIARVEGTFEENRQADERLTALVRAIEEPDAQLRLNELRQRAEAENIDVDAEIAELEDVLRQLRSDLDPVLGATTLPIGPSYFPYGCVASNGTAPPACSVFEDGFFAWGSSLGLWLVNVILAGLFIGLGGPFWYRVFSSLSHLAQLLRMINGGGHSEVMKTDAADQPATRYAFREATAAVEDGDEQGDIVTVFYTAAGHTPPRVVDGLVLRPDEKAPTKPGIPEFFEAIGSALRRN